MDAGAALVAMEVNRTEGGEVIEAKQRGGAPRQLARWVERLFTALLRQAAIPGSRTPSRFLPSCNDPISAP